MKKKKTKQIRILKREKLLCFVFFMLLIMIPISSVLTKALISDTNIEIEKLKKKISNQEKQNESLNIQINELVSFENIQSIADDYGLSYQYGNIVAVGGE